MVTMNRAQYIAQQIVSGASMASLGRELNISRERVRKIVHQEHRRNTELARLLPRCNEYGTTLLRIKRVTLGLNIGDAAKEIGMSRSRLGNFENGLQCKLVLAKKIADYYKLSVGELFILPEQ